MYEIYPTEESRRALTVFKICEGRGEWFDLSKSLLNGQASPLEMLRKPSRDISSEAAAQAAENALLSVPINVFP